MLVTVSTLAVQEAGACLRVQPALEASYPLDEATEVPTNVVLFAAGPKLDSAYDVVLLDAYNNAVPFDVRAVPPSGFDIIPRSELKTNASYQLRPAASHYCREIHFTTAAGPETASTDLT